MATERSAAKAHFFEEIKRLGLLCLASAIILSAMSSLGFAQSAGDLIVAPTRVVFEGRTRSAQLSLVNKGSATATFRISVVNMRMDEFGQLAEVFDPGPGEFFADGYFRYSPRQVTLEPGQAQAVRLLLRRKPDMADGEYRSHLFFRAIPPESAGQSIEDTKTPEGVSVQLIPIFGITIPVIVRHGDTQADIKLTDVELVAADQENGASKLRFRIQRKGNISSFGDLVATFKKNGGADLVVGEIRRLAVYVPGKSRIVEMRLIVPDGVRLERGRLKVSYRSPSKAGGKLYHETEIELP